MRKQLAVLVVLVSVQRSYAEDVVYQRPDKAVATFIDATPFPIARLGPDHHTLLLVTPQPFPPIAEVAEDPLRLAGVRINPKNRAKTRTFRTPYAQRLELLDSEARQQPRQIRGLPDGARIGDLYWSPDGASIAFTVAGTDAVRLWVADVHSATARQVAAPPLSAVFNAPCSWLPDSRSLICRTVPKNGTPPQTAAAAPTGPVVQENLDGKKPAPTYEDLLTSPSDERLFEFYAASQIVRVSLDGRIEFLGAPGLYAESSPSPDGKRLLVSSLHRPFSYHVPFDQFPVRTEVRALDGSTIAVIADLKLAEAIPAVRDAVRTGRREINWRSDAPATLCWVEAQDGGDPRTVAAIRDRMACASEPYAHPATLIELADRFHEVQWGTGKLALVVDSRWKDRHTRTSVVAPDDPAAKPRVLWDRSSEDRYGDPGTPVTQPNASGFPVLRVTGQGELLLTGEGASEQGNRPFLDRLGLASGKTTRLWRSDGERYASVDAIADRDGDRLIIRRETPSVPPQLYAYTVADKKERQLTHWEHPVPALAKVQKQLIKWKRKDGVALAGMLYLPPGFRPKRDRPLPVLVWVYPHEFKTADAASQVNGSPYRFVYPTWGGPLFALTQGYAVVDDPTFAIVGEGKTEPNDSYIEQLVDDASSLIDAVVALGVGDRDRFAVGGHSYGAFTTANLLAHSKLFRAGIARSGAYNRTLTPFGFQSEERSFWEASAIYDQMSPFRFANQITDALLMIHGAADDNTGTFPIQSDRLFAAMQGLGGTVRYVSLPAEPHNYRARESTLHVLWEQVRWLDTYVKNAKPRTRLTTR